MKKVSKIVTFLVVLFICIGSVIYKKNFNLGENIYVVSQSESKRKESIKDKEKNDKTNKSEEEDNNEIVANKTNEKTNSKMITVYISGEVNKPGIITIAEGKRLSDAVKDLGDFTEYVDLNRVNLAVKLVDEQHYIIPKIGEELQTQQISNNNQSYSSSENQNSKNKKININSATLQELDSLPGVGEATANKILRYREDNSSFKSIEEIKNVNGIGDKKYEDIKDLICTN